MENSYIEKDKVEIFHGIDCYMGDIPWTEFRTFKLTY